MGVLGVVGAVSVLKRRVLWGEIKFFLVFLKFLLHRSGRYGILNNVESDVSFEEFIVWGKKASFFRLCSSSVASK